MNVLQHDRMPADALLAKDRLEAHKAGDGLILSSRD